MRLIWGLGAAWLAASAAAAPAEQIHEATTVRAFADVELSGGRYTSCGMRVLFSDSTSADDVEMYDLTVAQLTNHAKEAPVTVVRATRRHGNILKDPNLAGSARLAPVDLVLWVATLPDPITLRERSTQDGTLIAEVDEARAHHPGDIGGALLERLINGEPVLLFWGVSATDQRPFRVRTAPGQDLSDTLQSCRAATR